MKAHVQYHVADQLIHIEQEEETKKEYLRMEKAFFSFYFWF
jgi:hypothetical protein